MNLVQSFLYHVYRTPKKTALLYEDKSYSFTELNTEINRYSNGFIAQGLKKGDKVSLFLKNSDLFIICAYAIWKAGGVLVPINYRLTANELQYIVKQSDSIAVITDEEAVATVVQAVESMTVKPMIYSLGEVQDGVHTLQELYTNEQHEPGVQVLPTDDAQILYTSGTTGSPKGVLLTHANVISVNNAVLVMQKLTRDDAYLLVAPAFHSAGMNMILTATYYAGATLVVVRDFHPVEVQKVIERHKVTISFAVPAMYNACLMVPKGSFDLSSVRSYIYGAAPMSPSMIEAAIDYFGSDQFYNAYGLTEAGPGGTSLLPEEHKDKIGSAGKAMPFLDVRVVNDEMEDVVPGEVGELVMRGGSIMKEYYKKPEETAKTFRDGWLLTGDLGTIDDEGYITLVDRKKDMIISGGENIYSVEVEQVLNGHPAVLESAIIGLPDIQWGEVVTAIIVKKEGTEIDEEEVKAF